MQILTNLCFNLLAVIFDIKFIRLEMGAMKANRFIGLGSQEANPRRSPLIKSFFLEGLVDEMSPY